MKNKERKKRKKKREKKLRAKTHLEEEKKKKRKKERKRKKQKIRPGLNLMSFLESPIAGEASDLWSCSLSDATQKREGELWVSEKRELWVKEKKMKKEK